MSSAAILDGPARVGGPAVLAAVAAIHASIDALAAVTSPTGLDPSDHARAVGELSRAQSRLAAQKLLLLAAADTAKVAKASGASGTDSWLAIRTHQDPAEAAREVRLGRELADRCQATQEALSDGRISPAHAQVITAATDRLPDRLTDHQRRRVEQSLVARAQLTDPVTLRREARRSLAEVEEDPAVVDAHENTELVQAERAAHAKTRLGLHDNGDGTVTGSFTIPQLHGDMLAKILATIAAPRRARLGAEPAQSGGRSDYPTRLGQGFCELIEHLPTDHLHPKTAATIVVTLDEDTLRGRLRAALADTGADLSAGQARRLACSAGIVPAVLDGSSKPLDLGRERRLFSPAIRLALAQRHHTCAAHGCQRPYSWCELHHRIPWQSGGKTDLANAIPLCNFHHMRIHDPTYTHHERAGGITFHRRT